MFNRDYYVTVIAKIAKDARIQERADNANELLYYITSEPNTKNINMAINLAVDLLYGAKASRPILKTLIPDLKKLATEHEQQELDLTNLIGNGGTGPVIQTDEIKPAEPINYALITKEEHNAIHKFGHAETKILEMVNKALNTVKELSITREALHRSIENDLDNIGQKFTEKNKRYGQDKDGFYNFTQGAKLHYGDASPDNSFRMLMAYTSKHIVALEQPDALTNDEEFDERCLDVAVYMMIARAMKKATREGVNNG